MSGTTPEALGIQDLIIGLKHVGVITTDMRASLDSFRKLYELRDEQVRVVPPLDEPCDTTRFAFVNVAGSQFELIEPIGEDFKRTLLSDRPGINHVAWEVRDIDAAVARLAQSGVRPGHVTPDGVIETPNFKMVYFRLEDTGDMLVELIEPKDGYDNR